MATQPPQAVLNFPGCGGALEPGWLVLTRPASGSRREETAADSGGVLIWLFYLFPDDLQALPHLVQLLLI